MTDSTAGEHNEKKVRIGLAMIAVVVAVAIGALVVVESAIGKAIMFAVAATAFVRAFLLVRWLKRSEGQGENNPR